MRLPANWRAAVLIGCGALLAACSADNPGGEPAVVKPAAPLGQSTKVVVQPGQSLDAIALAFHVPKREIIALNHLVPPYQLRAGAILEMPPGAHTAAAKPKAKSHPERAWVNPAPASVRTATSAPPPSRPNPKPSTPEVIPLD
jgi:LysM repeat protein